MGAALYDTEPVFAACVDECADLLAPHLGFDVRAVIRGAEGKIETPLHGLPALFAVSLATARLLASWGVRPDAVLGHSAGEYTAAVAAGALDVADVAPLLAVRCRAMTEVAGDGAMLAVPLAEDAAAARLRDHPDLDLAVVNGPDACVVSGPRPAVDALAADLRRDGHDPSVLRFDVAAHSRLIDPALPRLRRAAAGLRAVPPRVPLVSTLTGTPVNGELADAEHWVRQLREPVRFSAALRAAASGPRTVVVHVGPGIGARRARAPPRPGRAAHAVRRRRRRHHRHVRGRRGAVGARRGRRLRGHAPSRPPPDRRARPRVPAPPVVDRTVGVVVPPSGRRRPAGRDRTPAGPRVAAGPAARRTVRARRLVDRRGPGRTRRGDRRGGAGPHGRGRRSRPDGRGRRRPDTAWTGVIVLPDAGAGAGAGADLAEPPVADTGHARPDESDAAGAAEAAEAASENAHFAAVGEVSAGVLRYAELARRFFGGERPAGVLLQVTRGAQRVGGGDRPDPGGAAVHALPRVLAQEQRGVRWRVLDLDAAAEPGAVVRAELADLVAGGSGAETAVRDAPAGSATSSRGGPPPRRPPRSPMPTPTAAARRSRWSPAVRRR
ncbi:acyltransferase domain-containing protein, partial [Actinomadura sp. CNU-125]|uniref:acyltransferase domain-containing protein n=1 Tax=Actinomadura sp. CNU-125 TaxID=1904961 RepID=UPI0021CCDD3A